MKKRRARTNRSVYMVIGGLNIGVLVMFGMVLFPKPTAPIVEPVVASVLPKPAPLKTREAKVGTPNRVIVPAVGIDKEVQRGSYTPENQAWTIDDYATFHADRTVPANDSNGTTLIYGHATWAVFGRLPEIGEGARAEVHTREGLIFKYKFESSKQVEPSDTSVLTAKGAPKLVLQTCSGAFDTYCTLVTFKLVGVTKE